MYATQIGETAGGEAADQVKGERRGAVGAQHALRIRSARRCRPGEVVHRVAAVRRDLDGAVDSGHDFHRVRARLCVLPGDAAHLDDRDAGAVGQDDRHLQQRFHLVAHVVQRQRGERLGTVAALEQECLTPRNRGEPLTQRVAFAGQHQRRKRSQCGQGAVELRGVAPVRLLRRGQRPPRVDVDTGHDATLGLSRERQRRASRTEPRPRRRARA